MGRDCQSLGAGKCTITLPCAVQLTAALSSLLRTWVPMGLTISKKAIERQHQRTFNITFTGAMSRLWVLVSPDKLIIGFAFTALVIAALSEITIPHFVAAMIFSAQKGMTNDFYNNARLLVMMSCTYGLFRFAITITHCVRMSSCMVQRYKRWLLWYRESNSGQAYARTVVFYSCITGYRLF